ncbi:MAG: hypothetical protein KF851_13180 [Pirellulaceae bacterium]|nr:hypothetical protein [Pirellulaceae bacterium]
MPTNPSLILVLNLAATWYLVGLVWMVQVVHYPLFSKVGNAGFSEYETDHANRITPIVGIPMLLELVTAVLLCVVAPLPLSRGLMVAGLAMVLFVWLSTALIQVPCHTKLGQGFEPSTHQWLVTSNWLRTAAWTLRGILMTYACWLVLNHSLKPI